jgi:hypothetical protein
MTELLVLGGAIVALWVLFIVLRVPALAVFLSVFAGHLLASEASSDAYSFIGSVLRINQYYYVQVGLFLLPLLLTILFLRGKLARSKIMLDSLPLLFAVLLLGVLVYPLIPSLQTDINKVAGGQIADYKVIVIIAASISALISLWFSYPSHHEKKTGKKKH